MVCAMSKDPKRSGRPPLPHEDLMKPITVRFPRAVVVRLESLRRSRLDRPSKSTLVRELVAKALDKPKE